MDENTTQPPPAGGAWWFAWILATVIIPGGAFALLAASNSVQEVILPLAGLFVFVLHLTACLKLGKNKSGWLTFGLIFGGWALMLVSFFVGCLALVAQGK